LDDRRELDGMSVRNQPESANFDQLMAEGLNLDVDAYCAGFLPGRFRAERYRDRRR
jgi:hypothetical protein